MKAAVYVRVSTNRQEEEGTSLATQEEGCRRYAAEQGFEVEEAHVYREVHTGIELWERPELNRLREAVRQKEVNAVIAYAIDRLARDPVHLGVIVSEADYKGVDVRFVTEPLDNTPEGQLIRFVRGYAAKVEHEKIRERLMRGKRAKVAAGRLLGLAQDLYGYRRIKELGIREIQESEASVLRRLYEQTAADVPIHRQARQLNEEAVPSASIGKVRFRNGRAPVWSRSTIVRMLRNPAYKGETYAFIYKKDRAGESSRLRPFEEWTPLPAGVTPAIVSVELWEAVQRKLDTNRGEATRNEERPYLLRGLLFCPVCGRRMVTGVEKRGIRTYRCSSYQSPGGHCGSRRLRAEPIEAWAWEQVAALLQNPEIIAAELKRRETEGPEPALLADRERLARQLDRIEKQQERLMRRFREGAADADDNTLWALLEREIGLTEAEKKETRRALAEIDQRLAGAQVALQQLDQLSHYCAAVREAIPTLSFAEKRTALLALGIRVIGQGAVKRNGPPDCRLEGSVPLPGIRSEEVISTPMFSPLRRDNVFAFSLDGPAG